MKYYKILNKEENHHGMQYHDGLNEDILPFNPSGTCQPGGMYFSREDILACLPYGPWLREVLLYKDSKIHKDTNTKLLKWKTDKFFLKSRERITPEVVQELIDKGANVNANIGQPLRWACFNNHIEIAEVLLKNNADVHVCEDEALRFAVSYGFLEIVKLLIEYGANIHALNDASLRWSSANGHLDIVKVLLEAGANVHADDEATLSYACRGNHLEIVKLLIKYGAELRDNRLLYNAICSNHLELVKFLVEKMC